MSPRAKFALAREHLDRALPAVNAEDYTEAVTWHESGVLPQDFSGVLDLLNQARKVAVYEGDEPELGDESLEDIAADVETAVELAERRAAS